MKSTLESLKTSTLTRILQCASPLELDGLKTEVLGKTGALTEILKGLKDLPADEKPLVGQLANIIKNDITSALTTHRETLEKQELDAKLMNTTIDITLPGTYQAPGKKHPLNQTMDHMVSILKRLGFSVETGPEVESIFYNFEALNIPANHPALDMHDTFYLKNGNVLRTHTSPVQIRAMQKQKPPIRIIAPGKVFRCDADVTHSPVFHQIEGLYVDKNVSFAHLKSTLSFLLKELFGKNQKIRFRASYFPFTEPSAEADVECFMCSGSGCSLCKKTGWIEILGAGMVNQNVLRHVAYDPEEVTGFAFGIGIERVAMLLYGVTDIRLFYENDIRFLKQF